MYRSKKKRLPNRFENGYFRPQMGEQESNTVEALARMDHDALRTVGVGRMGDRLTVLGRARDALLTRENAGGLQALDI